MSSADGVMQVALVSADIWLFVIGERIAASKGHSLTAAPSVEQAVQSAGGPFTRILIVDLRLPGLDIEALVNRARRANPQVKIFAFGPHVHEQSLAAAKAAGCDEVFTRGQFEGRLETLLSDLKAPEDWGPRMGEFVPE
jgi:CheY-like chemotaxis protein